MDMNLCQECPSDNKSFFKELVDIHEETIMNRIIDGELETFILEHRDRFNTLDYLKIAIAPIENVNEYYEKQFEFCSFIFDFMNKNPDWKNLKFGVLGRIRMYVFYETFEEYLKNRKE